MKLADIHNPARFDWLADQGFRLDASPYLSGAYEARKLLERLPGTEPLYQVVRTANGIFHAGRSSRRWVTDPGFGVPFFSSTDILEADSSFLPLIAKSAVNDNPRLLIERDWTLITRSGTVGRMAYARPDMDGFACSEHVLRVVPDVGRISPGYLYAFLSSRYGELVNDQAAVVDGDHFGHRDQAGLGIHGDLGELHTASVIGRESRLPLAVDYQRGDSEFLARGKPILPADVGQAALGLHLLEGLRANVINRRGDRGARGAAAAAWAGREMRVPYLNRNLLRL